MVEDMDGERSEIWKTRLVSVVNQLHVRVKIRNGQLVEGAAGQRKVEEPTALFDVADNLIDDFGR